METILVIEDDEIMLKVAVVSLERAGFKVIVAKDGKEAFEKLDSETYDIVLTDLMMPYANGLEVLSKVRNDESKNHIGVIVVSSVGNEDSILEAFRLGADDYIKKPLMINELIIRVKKLLLEKKRLKA